MKKIKVIAIWTQSIDGFIAKNGDDDLSWGAKADKQWFSKVTKAIGVVVMGRKTAELIGKPLPGRLNIVMSKQHRANGKWQIENNLIFTDKKPREILADLEKRGFKQVVIGGGASIYTLWFKEKLVDEVWASLQPVVLGQGIKAVEDVGVKMKLIGKEDIGEGVVVMKYAKLL